MTYDILIIGAGPAGMNAALNAARAGRSVLLIEKETIGGQISFAPKVENFPTVYSTAGADLMDKLYDQISEWGVELAIEEVVEVKKNKNLFTVKTDSDKYTAKSIIIATGVKHRMLNVEGEENLLGNGISYCALCDGQFFEGRDVVVIGDGNTALQYTMLLSTYCKSVTVCTLFDRFFGDKVLADRVIKKTSDNIKVIHNVQLTKLIGKDELEGMEFKKKDGTHMTINAPGLFVCIGQIPSNDIFKDLVEIDKDGYIVASENGVTSTPGIFVAGDCRTKGVRQMITALGDGSNASFNACNYLDSL